MMEATLRLEDTLFRRLEEIGRKEGKSVDRVTSDLLEEALRTRSREVPDPDSQQRRESFYGFEPFPHRGGSVTNELIDKLREAESI